MWSCSGPGRALVLLHRVPSMPCAPCERNNLLISHNIALILAKTEIQSCKQTCLLLLMRTACLVWLMSLLYSAEENISLFSNTVGVQLLVPLLFHLSRDNVIGLVSCHPKKIAILLEQTWPTQTHRKKEQEQQ